MAVVELSEQKWQQVLGMISLAPWRDANPLLMEIGAQLQAQQPRPPTTEELKRMGGIRLDANGQEVRHE
jgi:hypothetical protein